MVNFTLKTVYCCLHDAPRFGEEPIVKMEIHQQGYISHQQLVEFRHRLENYIEAELHKLVHKVEYNGAWPA